MPGFEVRATRTVGSYAFLDVLEQRLAAPDGEEFVRYTVTHPGAVAVVPVDSDGRAVVVRQFRVPVGRDLLEIPAGKRDVPDEPPETTARRELEEEIGQTPGRLVKLAEFYNSPGFCTELTHVFVALDLRPVAGSDHLEGMSDLKAEERHMTMETVAFDDVDALVASGAIADAKTIIGLMLARHWLDAQMRKARP